MKNHTTKGVLMGFLFNGHTLSVWEDEQVELDGGDGCVTM